MTVDPVRGRSAALLTAGRAKRGQDAFAGHLDSVGTARPGALVSDPPDPAPPEATGLTQAGHAASMSALQTAELLTDPGDDASRDARARDHGRAVLDALLAVQTDLLRTGSASSHAACLQRLERLAKEAPEAADPALEGVLREIRVRAAVTLAQDASREIVAVG